MIKKLDLYIIRKFLTSFFFITPVFLMIAVVIDLTEKVDNLIDSDATLAEVVFDYYLNFLPYIGALMSHLFIFIVVIIFTSGLAYKSEIVAILSSGVSYYRFLVPYILSAILLSLLLFFANHYWVPESNKVKFDFENRIVNKNRIDISQNIHLQSEKDIFVSVSSFTAKSMEGHNFSLQKIRRNKIYYQWNAKKIKWNENKMKWTVYNYDIRTFGTLNDEIVSGVQLDTAFSFRPEDFYQTMNKKESMTTPQLKEYIAQQKLAGDEGVIFYEVERHRRTAESFSVFILTLIGVAVSSRKIRGGRGFNIVLGFAIALIYIVFMKFAVTFSTNASLPPLIATWIPNFIFGIIAVLMIRLAPK